MLHIAICDDEKDFVQYLTDLLNQYSKETGRDIKITAYYDGMELIEKYDTTVDLIFLDIRMKLVNGLHAAERIRQMDERVGIIFLTTLTQYGLEGYKYQATNYIIKPLKYARLKSELNKFVERSQKEENPFLVIANDTGKYNAQKLKMQQNYYEAKLKNEERIRSIYHDMKNHLLVMESKQNTEETRQMAETLRSQIADYEDYVHTGNEFLDIILKDKAAKAREKQIDFSAMVDFHGIDFMEPLDISTIFGNTIDNAIEASENLPEYKRLITVKAERVRDMLLITIENNTQPGNHLTEGTTKKDRFVHGFGIPNIKKAVEKYSGQCNFQQKERVYRLKILIPCP